MAIYPDADWMPLSENRTEPFITATQVIFHTAVDQPGPSSLWPFFEHWTDLESHFFVRWDRTEQYIDTARQADANRNANVRAISIETEDDGSPSTTPWNTFQQNALVDLLVWAHRTHGVPLRICRTPTDPGVGWHAMWGSPSDWTPSEGKTCPGPARIAQIPGILARAQAIAEGNEPPTTDKELTMDIRGLRRNDKGPRVVLLQRMLLRIDPNALPEFGPDGDFGRETVQAVGRVLNRAGAEWMGKFAVIGPRLQEHLTARYVRAIADKHDDVGDLGDVDLSDLLTQEEADERYVNEGAVRIVDAD